MAPKYVLLDEGILHVVLLCMLYPVILTGPINCSVAHKVVQLNYMKILKSDVDVFQLSAALYSCDVIPKTFHKEIIDRHIALSANERLNQLVSIVHDAMKDNGEIFKKLLLSLAECEEQTLSNVLYQHYCTLV